jgi:hypothetical protein
MEMEVSSMRAYWVVGITKNIATSIPQYLKANPQTKNINNNK